MRTNPFVDPDRAQIWEMLVDRDIRAFCAADWSMVADDFIVDGFMGLDGSKVPDPDQWTVNFPDLATYKKEWMRQADLFQTATWIGGDPVDQYLDLTSMTQIDIKGNAAVAHKKFDGTMTRTNGTSETFKWQTLYQCRKVNGQWKIAGFIGYLPYPLGSQQGPSQQRARKRVPPGAVQHSTAGPYSPVLEIDGSKMVVISGQAALDLEGNVIGDTIEEQTKATLENCKNQLSVAGCTLADVFKVNVFLKDLADWPRFNAIYQVYFPDPKPVRTAVQTPLLMTFLVEIELWAVKEE